MTPLNLLVGSSIIIFITGIVLVIRANKLRSSVDLRNEFISIISHKFRTPLTSVRWLTENLISSEKDDFRRKDLQDVHTLNLQLINLINTLIELTDSQKSTKEQYTFEVTPVCALVNECAKTIKESAGEKNISFAVNCTDETMKVNVDKIRFEFVIHTILQNSVIYTKAGGKVDVTIAPYEKKVVINVLDTGIGISKEELPHIFTEFYRAPNAESFDTEGLGVGLFLAQRIAKRLGGEIRVSSGGEGQGSLFEIILPMVG